MGGFSLIDAGQTSAPTSKQVVVEVGGRYGGPPAGEVERTPSKKKGRTPSRELEAMGMGDRPPSYSASNSMVAFILSK